MACRLRLGVVELELDRVGTALRGHLGHPDCIAETAVMVHPCFGNDEDAHSADASFAPCRTM